MSILILPELEFVHPRQEASIIHPRQDSVQPNPALSRLLNVGFETGNPVKFGMNTILGFPASLILWIFLEILGPIQDYPDNFVLDNSAKSNDVQGFLQPTFTGDYFPKASRELKAVAEVMEERIIKPKRLQGMRWMPHMQKDYKVLIQGFHPIAIVAHFKHISSTARGSNNRS